LATRHIGYSRYGDLKTPISGKREIGYHAKNGKTARSAGSAFADQL
jgi:hypothetical protein